MIKTRSTFVKVPIDRVGVIIGPEGTVKQLIEQKSATTLDIDSKTGSIEIKESKDPLLAMQTIDVIKAIGRGFNPDKAMRRIIGKSGKSREIFENMTETKISVMGKTVSVLGHTEHILVVRTGIEMLINGSPHGPVFSYLEKKRRELQLQ
jgi:ribosomal RNA assembly protein